MKRKRNKREISKTKNVYKEHNVIKNEEDTTLVIKGRNVDYTKFVLYFKINPDTTRLDSIEVVHSSEFRTIIETDQSRLDSKLDTLVAKISAVYIKEFNLKDENISIIRARNKSICKYLHQAGISNRRIKMLKGSE